MFRVTLICEGLPTNVGEVAARDITNDFMEHRPWHKRVSCEWDGARLILRAENDFDENGNATRDEFDDCITAYVELGDYETRVESVTELDDDNA
ncbi:MAG TPA: hypothetical protein VFZ59_21300 [Verrucomicrobiae bacterium]|nr:hypothetical protein [Verrucomicrobiae bacterium]